MLLTTTDQIPNHAITRVHGLVKGITVRNPAVKGGLKGILKILSTGTAKFYGQACTASREEAEAKLIEQAESLGANAVVGVRFETSLYYEHLTEIIAYGTAVTIEDKHTVHS